jgi:hypothetical protein
MPRNPDGLPWLATPQTTATVALLASGASRDSTRHFSSPVTTSTPTSAIVCWLRDQLASMGPFSSISTMSSFAPITVRNAPDGEFTDHLTAPSVRLSAPTAGCSALGLAGAVAAPPGAMFDSSVASARVDVGSPSGASVAVSEAKEPMTEIAAPNTTDRFKNSRRDAIVPDNAGNVVEWLIVAHLPC